MENIKTPKWVEEQLSEGEKVLSKVSSGGRMNLADYYATNKRLLRFRGKSDCDALEYDKISINFKKHGLGTGIIRIIVVLFGLLVISLGIVSFMGPTFQSGTTIYHLGAPFEVSLLLWLMGLFVIAVALHGRYGYYQIESPSFDEKDLKKWRIMRNRWGAEKVERLAKTVRERSLRS